LAGERTLSWTGTFLSSPGIAIRSERGSIASLIVIYGELWSKTTAYIAQAVGDKVKQRQETGKSGVHSSLSKD
jgi:hypothetical protein